MRRSGDYLLVVVSDKGRYLCVLLPWLGGRGGMCANILLYSHILVCVSGTVGLLYPDICALSTSSKPPLALCVLIIIIHTCCISREEGREPSLFPVVSSTEAQPGCSLRGAPITNFVQHKEPRMQKHVMEFRFLINGELR